MKKQIVAGRTSLRSVARIFGIVLFSIPCCLSFAWRSQAHAQQHGLPPGVSAPAERAASRGKIEIKGIEYTEWRKFCFRLEDTRTVCRTTISGTNDVGSEVLRVDLIEGGKDDGARLQILVPSGMSLKSGIRVIVDERDSVTIPYAWCFSNGCMGGDFVNAEFLKSLQRGRKLELEVVGSRLIILRAEVPFSSLVHVPPLFRRRG
jgi:invasion protein IalB